jgi:hypothetical protein
MMGVEWCWGTTRRMSKNDECVGKHIKGIRKHVEGPKKMSKIYTLFCFVSKHEEAHKRALEIFILNAKNNCKGDNKGR